MTYRIVCLVGLCLAFATPPCLCQSSPKDPSTEDDRLNKSVTIKNDRVYVGELLDALTQQTGVTFSTGEKDGSADAVISVFADNVPVRLVMDGLWSLLSYKRATWRWERTGEPGRFEYRLLRPPAARALASDMRDSVQKEFERQTEILMRAARMSPTQRIDFLRRAAPDIYGDDPKAINYMSTFERAWTGLRLFEDSLSPEMRLKVLRGVARIQTKAADMTDEGREFLHAQWLAGASNATMRLRDGTVGPVPEPMFAVFYTSRTADRASPTLIVALDNMGGYGYVGGLPLDKHVRKLISQRWMLDGDASQSANDKLSLKDAAISGSVLEYRKFEQRLSALAKATKLLVLGRAPSGDTSDPGDLGNKTVGEYIGRVRSSIDALSVKWRGDALLVSDPTWVWDDIDPAPWLVVKSFRQHQKQSSGFLPLEDIFYAGATLTTQQASSIAREFPEMGRVNAWRDMFALCHKSKQIREQILSESGAPVTPTIMQALAQDPVAAQYLRSNPPKAIRLAVEPPPNEFPSSRRIVFSIQNHEGKWRRVMGFLQRARPQM